MHRSTSRLAAPGRPGRLAGSSLHRSVPATMRAPAALRGRDPRRRWPPPYRPLTCGLPVLYRPAYPPTGFLVRRRSRGGGRHEERALRVDPRALSAREGTADRPLQLRACADPSSQRRSLASACRTITPQRNWFLSTRAPRHRRRPLAWKPTSKERAVSSSRRSSRCHQLPPAFLSRRATSLAGRPPISWSAVVSAAGATHSPETVVTGACRPCAEPLLNRLDVSATERPIAAGLASRKVARPGASSTRQGAGRHLMTRHPISGRELHQATPSEASEFLSMAGGCLLAPPREEHAMVPLETAHHPQGGSRQ